MTQETIQELEVEWLCPCRECSHSLTYRQTPAMEAVAELAMVSHLVRCHGHGSKSLLNAYPYLEAAIKDFFNAKGVEAEPCPLGLTGKARI